MMRRLRDERGFTLVELLAGMALVVVVSAAALGTMSQFERTTRVNSLQNDSQQEARRALGEMARELRNLASPTNELPQAIERATATELVSLTVGDTKPAGSQNSRNTRRVRYCLNTAGGKLWRQVQAWTTATAPAIPSDTACPAAPATGGWGQATAAASSVTNGARAVWTYNSAQLDGITEIRATLYVDVNPGAKPKEAEIETAIFLRNQNRGPVADFTAAASGPTVTLNASESTDPEGRALTYKWYEDGNFLGEGITYVYNPSQGGNHSYTLKVEDPAGLSHTAPAQTVCVTIGGATC